jgi:hypothetical protein
MLDEADTDEELIDAMRRFSNRRGEQILYQHLATILILAAAKQGNELAFEPVTRGGKSMGVCHVTFTAAALAKLREQGVL